MVSNAKELDDNYFVIDTKSINAIQKSLAILEEKFDLRWSHQDMQFKAVDQRLSEVDRKIEKLDGRFWQMIMILVSYPIALIIGKLCHLF